jgi:hypothetical protein
MYKSRVLVHGSSHSRKIMGITIPEAIKQLCQVVKRLQVAYPGKKFVLDGRPVGDLSEVLAQFEYGQ